MRKLTLQPKQFILEAIKDTFKYREFIIVSFIFITLFSFVVGSTLSILLHPIIFFIFGHVYYAFFIKHESKLTFLDKIKTAWILFSLNENYKKHTTLSCIASAGIMTILNVPILFIKSSYIELAQSYFNHGFGFLIIFMHINMFLGPFRSNIVTLFIPIIDWIRFLFQKEIFEHELINLVEDNKNELYKFAFLFWLLIFIVYSIFGFIYWLFDFSLILPFALGNVFLFSVFNRSLVLIALDYFDTGEKIRVKVKEKDEIIDALPV